MNFSHARHGEGEAKVAETTHSDLVSGSDVNIALWLALEYHNINVKVYKTLERTQAGLSETLPVHRILVVSLKSSTKSNYIVRRPHFNFM